MNFLLHYNLSAFLVNNELGVRAFIRVFCSTRAWWRHAHVNGTKRMLLHKHMPFPAECKWSLFLVPVSTILFTSESVFPLRCQWGCRERTFKCRVSYATHPRSNLITCAIICLWTYYRRAADLFRKNTKLVQPQPTPSQLVWRTAILPTIRIIGRGKPQSMNSNVNLLFLLLLLLLLA
jgi:hypothetical protein